MAATIMASGVYVTKAPATSGTASPAAGYPIAMSGRYSAKTPSVPLPNMLPTLLPTTAATGIISQSHIGLQQATAVASTATTVSGSLQAEIARRQAAEARVRELEAMVAQLQQRVAALESGSGGRPPRKAGEGRAASASPRASKVAASSAAASADKGMSMEASKPTEDPIDRAICEYLERNPDFPVSIQKVAHNYYVFGDRGTVYATQRGDHIVVRVGGGYKSLQVFMDERALMVTRETATALAEKTTPS